MDTGDVQTPHREWLYEQVAGNITHLIERGTFRPGERIPSVRQLSHQQRVSITTALQAVRLLEDRGLIEVRPQSGYYVRAHLPPFCSNPKSPRPNPIPHKSVYMSW